MTRPRVRLPKERGDPLEGWGTYLGAALLGVLGILGYVRGDVGLYESGAMVAGAFGLTRLRAAVGREQR